MASNRGIKVIQSTYKAGSAAARGRAAKAARTRNLSRAATKKQVREDVGRAIAQAWLQRTGESVDGDVRIQGLREVGKKYKSGAVSSSKKRGAAAVRNKPAFYSLVKQYLAGWKEQYKRNQKRVGEISDTWRERKRRNRGKPSHYNAGYPMKYVSPGLGSGALRDTIKQEFETAGARGIVTFEQNVITNAAFNVNLDALLETIGRPEEAERIGGQVGGGYINFMQRVTGEIEELEVIGDFFDFPISFWKSIIDTMYRLIMVTNGGLVFDIEDELDRVNFFDVGE